MDPQTEGQTDVKSEIVIYIGDHAYLKISMTTICVKFPTKTKYGIFHSIKIKDSSNSMIRIKLMSKKVYDSFAVSIFYFTLTFLNNG